MVVIAAGFGQCLSNVGAYFNYDNEASLAPLQSLWLFGTLDLFCLMLSLNSIVCCRWLCEVAIVWPKSNQSNVIMVTRGRGLALCKLEAACPMTLYCGAWLRTTANDHPKSIANGKYFNPYLNRWLGCFSINPRPHLV